MNCAKKTSEFSNWTLLLWDLDLETGFAARNRVSSFECLVGIPKKNKRPQKLVPPEGILRGDLGVPG